MPSSRLVLVSIVGGALTSLGAAWLMCAYPGSDWDWEPAAGWRWSKPRQAVVRQVGGGRGFTVRTYRIEDAHLTGDGGFLLLEGGMARNPPKIPVDPSPMPSDALFLPDSNWMSVSSYGLPFRCLST